MSKTSDADETMLDPSKLHEVIRYLLDELPTSYIQDAIPADNPELEEFARQLDFYIHEGTTEGAFR